MTLSIRTDLFEKVSTLQGYSENIQEHARIITSGSKFQKKNKNGIEKPKVRKTMDRKRRILKRNLESMSAMDLLAEIDKLLFS